jgi:hypothetical protein
MIVDNPPGSPSGGVRVVAIVMVVLGAYVAFGTFSSPAGPDPRFTSLWLAQGLVALATAATGFVLIRRPAAAVAGIVTIAIWLLVSAAMAVALGLSTFANPFTVGTTLFLVIALITLLRR